MLPTQPHDPKGRECVICQEGMGESATTLARTESAASTSTVTTLPCLHVYHT